MSIEINVMAEVMMYRSEGFLGLPKVPKKLGKMGKMIPGPTSG